MKRRVRRQESRDTWTLHGSYFATIYPLEMHPEQIWMNLGPDRLILRAFSVLFVGRIFGSFLSLTAVNCTPDSH